ncbi:RGD1564859 (predicted), isoform CRA_a [Rattus norvegicus]|uniref:RGD1564859 (Predicted), isoform CRA_a n=1 Tax=Rattus norvegicus TaxID=10116 RepID=A6J840_RAT|nr:RGD1564859 (predicted), isoform CRA_a [Rattus norvegicus]
MSYKSCEPAVGKACTGTAKEISLHLLLSHRLSRAHFTPRDSLSPIPRKQ